MTHKTKNNSRSVKAKLFASSAIIAGSTFVAAPAFAHPEDEPPGEFSANITLATDYLYRGVTQTDGGPAVSGGMDYAVDLFYVGAWASNVEWDGTSVEIDYYAGLTPSYGQFSFDVGFLYYSYPDSPDTDGEQDFLEFYAGASTEVTEGLEVGAKISFSPDFYLETGEAYYPELSLTYSFLEKYSVSAHVGQQIFDDDTLGDDYVDWNISFTYSWDWFDISLGYYDTTNRIGGDDDDAVVLSISRSF